MRKLVVVFCLLLLTVSFSHRALAQEAQKSADTAKAAEPTEHFYHLDFVVQELSAEGKPTNSRTYTTMVSTIRTQWTQIRTNSRVPIPVESVSDPKSSMINTQFQYQDLGVNFDVSHTHEVGHNLALEVTAAVSSIAASSNADIHQPVIRSNRWQSAVLIPIGKPTVVFTSDALDSKGSMQVVLTATSVQ